VVPGQDLRADDSIAPFSLDGAPVRGRIVRLGPAALNPILRRHDYPAPVAMLLGEALALAALMASLLKREGRLTIQAEGDGPARLLVAEHAPGGALRGYVRMRPEARALLARKARMAPRDLIGEGAFAMTLDEGGAAPVRQGVVPLEGETLARCARLYFSESEQVETQIHLAVGEVMTRDAPPVWRAGGILMQRIAADAARGDPAEDWSRATILMDTLTDAELLDPDLSSDRVLYRLFHEEGVRMSAPTRLHDQCSCDEQRLRAVLSQLSPEELAGLSEPDGALIARCQFCAREYHIAAPGA